MPSLPDNTGPRLAARALIVENGKLLLVNAYPGGTSDLWCAPGGGVEKHQSIHDNVKREVFEETGLTIAVGDLAGVNEFHEPGSDFHQVDLYFHATILSGALDPTWKDEDAIVDRRQFMSREEMMGVRFKPDLLPDFAFGEHRAGYDPLERLVR
ncbi:NUDIX domain-containing protein [Ahrensia marina]|uniref:NUDIX domain-containing protein n=1 Tax=Ahrensia marina TaxID=1514904 RepID=UPI0035CEE211